MRSNSSTARIKPLKDKSMTKLYFLGNATKVQMMGFVIVSDGATVVIDGGSFGDNKQLSELLSEVSGGHVDAWFFTHPHHDHIGAFYKIIKHKDNVTVDRIYHHFPPLEALKELGSRHEGEIALWEGLFKRFDTDFKDKVHVISAGDVYSFGKLTISVLRTYNEEITENFVNNSSAVMRLDGEKSSVLILGDLGREGGDEVKEKCHRESLVTDYTQMAHHGQGGVRRDFYEYIKPKACLWPTPDWLYNNDNGDGFDTGPWQTVRTREWIEELGVKEHIIEKDGTTVIDI